MITGASVVVYIGRGYGFRSPYSSTVKPYVQDGFGLNPASGGNNSTTRYYGEAYIRTVRLAPKATVLLAHLSYGSGDATPGRPQPTLSGARRWVDNLGGQLRCAGFLVAGASSVIAEAVYAPTYYIRAIFTKNASLDSVWRGAPTYHGHVTSFSSTRTRGAVGRTDPSARDGATTARSSAGRLRRARRSGVAVPLWRQCRPPAGIPVPSSIDATGAADASAALISFVGSVPDGSTIVFKAGGVYRMNAALMFANRHNLTFEGNGATLKASGGTTEASSLFWLASYAGGNSGIVIRDFNLVGNSPTPGVYQGGKEGAQGVLVAGSSNVEIANVTISAVWGDGVTVDGVSDTVWFHDSRVVSAGRNGVTVDAGNNITIERVALDKSGYCTFDIEPYVSTGVVTNVKFLNNTAGTWTNSFLSADGVAGSVVNGVTVSGNKVTGGSLLTVIDLARRQNIVFTNNTSTVPAAGPALRFAHVDGLTVTGNIQPLTSGVLASITDSTGVTYR